MGDDYVEDEPVVVNLESGEAPLPAVAEADRATEA
jgi:hypothetical protein